MGEPFDISLVGREVEDFKHKKYLLVTQSYLLYLLITSNMVCAQSDQTPLLVD